MHRAGLPRALSSYRNAAGALRSNSTGFRATPSRNVPLNGASQLEGEELFEYTSGRWLCNDHIQRTRRYVRFDVDALRKIAAKACGAEECVSVKKMAEGSFNRVLRLTFDDGREAIARLPFPMAGHPHLLTASEVATLDFVRNIMSIKVPKVLAWSSRAASTPVGAEFMILEKVEGVEIAKPWTSIQKGFGQINIIADFLGYDKKFATTHFSMNGSLFYKDDVIGYPHTTSILADPKLETEGTRRFAIGRHMAWELWNGERVDMKVDRGPWNSASEYMTGFIRCQQKWLRQIALPRFTRDHSFTPMDGSTPNEHIDSDILERVLLANQALLCNFQWPVLWHPDLHRANIFVTDSAPYNITGLIDWQYASISPFFSQVSIPKAFQYSGSRVEFVRDCFKPPLPENFDSLSEEEKKLTLEERFDAGMHAFYKQKTQNVPNAHVLLTHKILGIVMQSFWSSLTSWDAGLQPVQMCLAALYAHWEEATGGDPSRRCPYEFSEQEFTRLVENHQRFSKYQDNVEFLRSELGCLQDGWVPTELYDEAIAKSKQLEAGWDEAKLGGPYPFRDGQTSLMT